MDEWKDLFAQVDANGDGLLSEEELISCYQDARIRDKLNMMGIDGSDLEVIIDNSKKDPETGRISYEAFLDTFIKAGRQTNQTYLMICKLHLESVGRGLKSLRSELNTLKRMNSKGRMISKEGSFSHNPQGSRRIGSKGPRDQGRISSDPTGSGQKRSGKEPAAAQGAALEFEAEMAGLGQRLREQFQGVMVSLEADIAALGQHARALQAPASARGSQGASDAPVSARPMDRGARGGPPQGAERVGSTSGPERRGGDPDARWGGVRPYDSASAAGLGPGPKMAIQSPPRRPKVVNLDAGDF